MPNRGLKRCPGRKRSPQSAHARVDRAAYALPAQKRLPTRNTGTRQTKRVGGARRTQREIITGLPGRAAGAKTIVTPLCDPRSALGARTAGAKTAARLGNRVGPRAPRAERSYHRVCRGLRRAPGYKCPRLARKEESLHGQRYRAASSTLTAMRSVAPSAPPPIWSSPHPRPGRKPGQGPPTNKRPVALRPALNESP